MSSMVPVSVIAAIHGAVMEFEQELSPSDRKLGWNEDEQESILKWLKKVRSQALDGTLNSGNCATIIRTIDMFGIHNGRLWDATMSPAHAWRESESA